MSLLPWNNILFLDIETASQFKDYEQLPADWKKLWDHKAKSLVRLESQDPGELYGRAAIYAEFGKVICISCGILQGTGEDRKLLIKSFCCEDEKELLQDFSEMLQKWAGGETKFLCAHNGKEFDFPYLCRRMIINRLPVPSILSIAGKKPWEVQHYDTLELWKFGDYKSFTSLNLLAQALGIETPKDDIDGSMVGDVYWNQQDLNRIVTYCQKDVITVAQILLRMHAEPGLRKENVEIKN